MNQGYVKALLSGDINHLVGAYTDDTCVIAPLTPPACVKNAIRDFSIAVIESDALDLKIETHALGGSGEMAHATGTLAVTGADKVKQSSRYVLILKKVQGLTHGPWKLYLDTWTSV